MEQLIQNYLHLIHDELNDTIKVNQTQLDHALELITKALQQHGRLHFTGIGKPSYVAKYMASLYSSTGTPSYFLDATEAIHGSLGQVSEHDVLIAISNSGETKELLDTIAVAKQLGIQVIAVCRNSESALAKLSEICLLAKVEDEGDTLKKPPRISILKEMVILQVLSMMLQDYHQLDLQQYKKWHPGGSIGASIQ